MGISERAYGWSQRAGYGSGALLAWGVFWAIALMVGSAQAHHPSGGGTAARVPVTLGSAGGLDPLSGQTGTSRTRLGLRSRYLRFEVPDGELGVRTRREHALLHELHASYAPIPEVAFEAGLPGVLRIPDGPAPKAGLGDLRLGVRAVPRIDPGQARTVSIAAETTFPTGAAGKGLSADEYITRVSSAYSQVLGASQRWTLTASAGLSWGWSQDTNVVVDYGGSMSFAVLPSTRPFVDLRAQTFTRNTTERLLATQRGGRRAGDTSLVATPGVTFLPAEGWILSAGPQIPLTRVKDFDVGAVLNVQYTLLTR
jgi:hypothetical protein